MKKTRKSNGEGTIYYNEKRKKYVAQCSLGYNKDGKIIRKTVYANTKKEVHAKLIEIQSKYNIGMYNFSENITLGAWMTKWMETYKIHNYKNSTCSSVKNSIRCVSDSKIGGMLLDKIKPSDIQGFINNLDLNPSSIRVVFAYISGAMKQAVAEKYILFNPCTSVTMPKLIKSDMVAMDASEKEIFLNYAKDNPYYDIFLFALNTGMRLSEICGLTRDCIDFEKNFIQIKQQLSYKNGNFKIISPKSKTSNRLIPMNETTKKILQKYMFSPLVNKDFVFYSNKNYSLLTQKILRYNAKRIFSLCYKKTKDDTFKKATFHTLRHTFATNWIVQGGNAVLLSKILGHSSPSFTMQVYVQPSTDDIKKEFLRIM